MKRSSLFGHTAELLDQILSSFQPADRIVREFYRERRYLGASDRRFVTERVFPILRHLLRLGALIERSGLPPVSVGPSRRHPGILLLAAYAIHDEHLTPESLTGDLGDHLRAAVPGVDPADALEGLAHAQLLPPADAPSAIAVETSFPESVVREWAEVFGVDETRALCSALNEQAPTSLRVNTLKCSVEECARRLHALGVETRPSAISPVGLRLQKRLVLDTLAPYRDGWFELQDEGSQLIAPLLGVQPGSVLVDACAGAGGKTLHAAALMRNQGSILALDVDGAKLRTLHRRSVRAGVTIIRTLDPKRDAAAIQQVAGHADAVLVDAPCSGLGTVRRNPGLKYRFGPSLVQHLVDQQRSLLASSSGIVREGGRLVYATCTISRRENDENVSWFLASFSQFRLLDSREVLRASGITAAGMGPELLLLPHRTGSDGFYAVVFQRDAG